MQVLGIGEIERKEEFLSRFPEASYLDEYDEQAIDLASYIFDFYIEENPEELGNYTNFKGILFVSLAKMSQSELFHFFEKPQAFLATFNGMPSFFDRDLFECALWQEADEAKLEKAMKALNWEAEAVADRVGLVTPRIICMIINEAFYTLQEGTATEEDIDQGMELGTSYPFGPFEWCNRIGLKNVYELLEAVYDDTHDTRYKICPLLKTRYLRA